MAATKRKPRTHKPYTGALARPIPYVPREGKMLARALLASAGASDEIVGRLRAESEQADTARAQVIAEKVLLLFDHFGIAVGDWVGLVLALARAHVPGFHEEQVPRGRRAVWSARDAALLRRRIEEVKAERRGRSFAQAAEIVAKTGEWGRVSGATLQRRARQTYPKNALATPMPLLDAIVAALAAENPP
ncbi:MAG TPA: hypothetical protein PLM09_04425 [Casimicrobiaceae bacterium]|nr:hypothetical protein [Casimicrobiaceae bacterium]